MNENGKPDEVAFIGETRRFPRICNHARGLENKVADRREGMGLKGLLAKVSSSALVRALVSLLCSSPRKITCRSR